MKQILLYSYINDWVVESIASQLIDMDRTQPTTWRFNTRGGTVRGGAALLSLISEFKGEKTAIVDGMCASMGAIMLPYFDKVIAPETGMTSYKLMFHKAAYPMGYQPTESETNEINATNMAFKDALVKKTSGRLGSEEFIAKVFEEGVRNDVRLTASEAMELGIVTEIRLIEPTAYDREEIAAVININNEQSNKQYNKQLMDITEKELEARLNQARAEGKASEHSRIKAFMAYMDIDHEAAMAGVKDPQANVDVAFMAEMQATHLKKLRLEALEADSPESVEATATGSVQKTSEQLQQEEIDRQTQLFLSL